MLIALTMGWLKTALKTSSMMVVMASMSGRARSMRVPFDWCSTRSLLTPGQLFWGHPPCTVLLGSGVIIGGGDLEFLGARMPYTATEGTCAFEIQWDGGQGNSEARSR